MANEEFKIVVYDCETLKENFLTVIYNPVTNETHEFSVDRWKNQLDAFMRFVEEYSDYYWVGYNNLRFDSQVVEWVIRNSENWHQLSSLEICERVSQKAQDVIHDANYEVLAEYSEESLTLKQIDLFKIHHFDNKNKRVSLKRLQFEMDMENLEEMPIHHLKENLTKEEIEQIRLYCINDVKTTYEFFKITIGDTEHPLYEENNQIETRRNNQEEFNIPALNYSNSKIGDEIIKKYYCETKNLPYNKLPRKGTFRKSIPLKHCIPKNISFKTPQLQKFLSDIKQRTLTQSEDFVESIEFYGQTYTFAKGGIHNVIKGVVYEADDENDLLDVDVSGYYPAIIINNSYYPAHLGKEFLVGYSKVYFKRIELKPLAKKDRIIKGIVAGLKEAGNCPYGKSSEMTSWLYDKQMTLSTCITGELSILMLIEECELIGIKCIMANTDGATFIVPKKLRDEFNSIKEQWRIATSITLTYELEEIEFKKMVFSSVNDYIAIKKDGEVKKKGDFATEFFLDKNKSGRIIPLALEQYYVNDTPIEQTIANHTNIYDFAIRQKATKDFHYEGVERKTGKVSVYNKLIRYYVSKTGEKLLKMKNASCTTNAPSVSQVEAGEWLCTVCNFLPKNHPLDNINYSYYIEKCNSIIRKIETGGRKTKIIVNPQQISLF
jgi:hypothetical protein